MLCWQVHHQITLTTAAATDRCRDRAAVVGATPAPTAAVAAHATLFDLREISKSEWKIRRSFIHLRNKDLLVGRQMNSFSAAVEIRLSQLPCESERACRSLSV
jgi:hypothetical protein